MYYDLKKEWHPCIEQEIPDQYFVAVLSKEDAAHDTNLTRILPMVTTIYHEIPFTRVEVYPDFIYGTVSIPAILNLRPLRFAFLFEPDRLYLIDHDQFLVEALNALLARRQKYMTDVGITFYYLLEYLAETDLEKINVIQDQLAALEKQLFDNLNCDYSRRLTEFRGRTLQLSHYYLQLTDLSHTLIENTGEFFSRKQLQLFSLFTNRVNLLREQSAQLWDYTSQVRDLYEEQLDVRQNQIMKLLTMVTTLFFPLSLITGWYGMNFRYMPELNYPGSYPVLIAVSVLIMFFLCLWFRRHHFW